MVMTQVVFDAGEFLNESVLQDWTSKVGRFCRIRAYSALGTLFLQDPDSSEVSVLLPLENELIDMQYFSWTEFVREVLTSEPFQRDALYSDKIRQLESMFGPLAESQIFIPEPYPFLGGSGELDTYTKGDLSVFLSIAGQSWSG